MVRPRILTDAPAAAKMPPSKKATSIVEALRLVTTVFERKHMLLFVFHAFGDDRQTEESTMKSLS